MKQIKTFLALIIILSLPTLISCTQSPEEQLIGYWKSSKDVGGLMFTDYIFMQITKNSITKMPENPKTQKFKPKEVVFEVTDKGIIAKLNKENALGIPYNSYKIVDDNIILELMYREKPLEYKRITEQEYNDEVTRRTNRKHSFENLQPKDDPF